MAHLIHFNSTSHYAAMMFKNCDPTKGKHLLWGEFWTQPEEWQLSADSSWGGKNRIYAEFQCEDPGRTDDVVQHLRRQFLGRAYQCAGCGYGPIDHFACGDLEVGGVLTIQRRSHRLGCMLNSNVPHWLGSGMASHFLADWSLLSGSSRWADWEQWNQQLLPALPVVFTRHWSCWDQKVWITHTGVSGNWVLHPSSTIFSSLSPYVNIENSSFFSTFFWVKLRLVWPQPSAAEDWQPWDGKVPEEALPQGLLAKL